MMCWPGLVEAAGPEHPSHRVMEAFAVHGASRLAALARVGALTHTTMLIEMGDLAALSAPVDLNVGRTSVRDAVDRVLSPAVRYTLRDEGNLLILSTATAEDRMLRLPLGKFSFEGGGYSSLDGPLTSAIRVTSGCELMGWAWAGPEVFGGIPAMHLPDATLERVVARVADGAEPSFWVVQTSPRESGCIDEPGRDWQVGSYGFGAGYSGCQQPLRGYVGAAFLPWNAPARAFPEPCKTNAASEASTTAPSQ